MNYNNEFQSKYEAFGRTLAYICRRNNITHRRLRSASHLGNDIITNIKKGGIRI